MKTDWSNYTIAYDGINYSVNYRDNGDLVACKNYVANSPTPKNPQPLISNLPAGTYKTKDWNGDWWEFTLIEDLCGNGIVNDSIEFNKYSPAIGWQRKNYSKKMYSGSANESWSLSSGAAGTNTQMFQLIEYNTTPVETAVYFPAYCSHAQYKNNLYNLDIVGIAGWLHTSGAYYIRIRVPNEIATNVSLFKTWLAAQHTAGTPVTVVYQLDTPTRTPLTFTLNNSSTAPECPMEFLTDTPSLEYPAEVFDASGTVKVANADNTQSQTATIEILRSNAAGTVCDEFEVKTGKLTRKIGRIESYNGEDVGDDWISSTGALDTGATVEYVLAEPIEEQYTPVTLPTYYPTTVVTTTNYPADNTPAELTTTATVKVEDE